MCRLFKIFEVQLSARATECFTKQGGGHVPLCNAQTVWWIMQYPYFPLLFSSIVSANDYKLFLPVFKILFFFYMKVFRAT